MEGERSFIGDDILNEQMSRVYRCKSDDYLAVVQSLLEGEREMEYNTEGIMIRDSYYHENGEISIEVQCNELGNETRYVRYDGGKDYCREIEYI